MSVDVCDTYCTNDNFISSFCSEKDYVDCHLEKQLLDEAYLVPVSIIMVLILLSGVVGNVSVCVVVLKHPAMKTVTNYYLFSLTVSDLLLLSFGLPQELSYYWHIYPDLFGNIMCKLRAFICETTTYASVLTVVAFSLERYVAICHPFRTCAISGFQRVVVVIPIIWTASAVCALPLTMGNVVEPVVAYPPNTTSMANYSSVCWLPNESDLRTYLATVSVLFFFIPMVVLAVAYVKIGLAIRSRTKVVTKLQDGLNANSRAGQDKTTMRVLAAVVIAFFVCWAPFHLQRLVNSEANDELKGPLFVITGILYYLSATVNPILYNVMSRRYREAFRETFFGSTDVTAKQFARKTNFDEEHSKSSITKSTC